MSTRKILYYIIVLTAVSVLMACSNSTQDTALSSSKVITEFTFTSPVVTGIIAETTHEITLKVPYGTSVSALVPSITHTGESISPASGTAQDFTNPVTYQVTASDGSTQAYTVTVTIASNPSKAINAFHFSSPSATGIITESTHEIALTVPFYTTVTALVPTISHSGESISPASGTAQDYSNPVTYTVTAADSSTQTYTITVTIALPMVTTLVRNSPDRLFNLLRGLAVDSLGYVYVADSIDNLIRKISPEGGVTTFAGSGTEGSDNGTGTAASFYAPSGLAVDSSGYIYVADSYNLIRKISPEGVVTTFAGSGSIGSDNGTGTAASFDSPYGVAVDSSGNIYVADTGNQMIRKISPEGVVSTLAGSGSRGSDNGPGALASFNSPMSIAVDSSGNIYVADTGNQMIRKISPEGVVTTFAGSGSIGSDNGTGTAASFNYPYGVAVGSSDNVYVADSRNYLIRKISPEGVVTTLAGSGFQGIDNGPGTEATFSEPKHIAVDSSGIIYLIEGWYNMIRKIE